MEAKNEAITTKEELNSCKENLENLDKLLQVRSRALISFPVFSDEFSELVRASNKLE